MAAEKSIDASSEYRLQVIEVLASLFLPLVRLLVRRFRFTRAEIIQALDRALVRAVQESLPDEEHNNVSYIALKSGLARSSVGRYLSKREPFRLEPTPQARILDSWRSSENWQDEDGHPLVLEKTGPWKSFSQLCKDHTGSYPWQTILKDLVAANCVEDLGSRVRFTKTSFRPATASYQRLAIGLRNVAHHLMVVEHNVSSPYSEANIKREDRPVWYEHRSFSEFIPADRLTTVRSDLKKLLRSTSETVERKYLDPNETDHGPVKGMTVWIGVYYGESPPQLS